MQVLTLFILRDKSEHKCIDKAKNHCQENMGAELRNVADKLGYGKLYQNMLDIVEHKKHDKAILEYIAWRNEMDNLEQWENMTYSEQGYKINE